MAMVESQPDSHDWVPTLRIQPQSWRNRAIESLPLDSIHTSDTDQREQERRWEETTGVPVVESSFTLVVPIHNEEHSLPSFLDAFLLSDIPESVPATIVFITNACTDSSQHIIRSFMEQWSPAEKMTCVYAPTGQEIRAPKARKGAMQLIHFDIPDAGKANALTLASHVSQSIGNRILMTHDANVFPELGAIREMFALTQKHIISAASPAAVITGEFHGVKRSHTAFMRHVPEQDTGSLGQRHNKLVGWFLACDNEFLQQIGGVPLTSSEDYALSLLARLEERPVIIASEVHVWGFVPNNFYDHVATIVRSSRGKRQLLRMFSDRPDALKMIQHDKQWLSPEQSIRSIMHDVLTHPEFLPERIRDLLVITAANMIALGEDVRNPDNHSWPDISSTK